MMSLLLPLFLNLNFFFALICRTFPHFRRRLESGNRDAHAPRRLCRFRRDLVSWNHLLLFICLFIYLSILFLRGLLAVVVVLCCGHSFKNGFLRVDEFGCDDRRTVFIRPAGRIWSVRWSGRNVCRGIDIVTITWPTTNLSLSNERPEIDDNTSRKRGMPNKRLGWVTYRSRSNSWYWGCRKRERERGKEGERTGGVCTNVRFNRLDSGRHFPSEKWTNRISLYCIDRV